MFRSTQPEPLPLVISCRTTRRSHGLAIQNSGYIPHRTPLGPDGGSYPWHVWYSNYGSTIVCGCVASLGCPPWSLLGLGLWYGAGRVEGVPSSLRVLATPTINQPSTIPLLHSTDLQNLKIFQCQLILLRTFLIDTWRYLGYLVAFLSQIGKTKVILDLHLANERRRYKVTPSLIGWVQT